MSYQKCFRKNNCFKLSGHCVCVKLIMENYMHFYFEEIFNNLDRDSLNERNKRRELVEYFCTVITGCAKGNVGGNKSI